METETGSAPLQRQTHRLVTEPLVALPTLSLPFRAAVDEAAAAAGSMFCEAMSYSCGDREFAVTR